jgi:hypothetical protein
MAMVVTDVPAAEDDKAEVEWILGKKWSTGGTFQYLYPRPYIHANAYIHASPYA